MIITCVNNSRNLAYLIVNLHIKIANLAKIQTTPLVGFRGNPIEFCITIPIMLDCSSVTEILGELM
jgi:hypothetical protein